MEAEGEERRGRRNRKDVKYAKTATAAAAETRLRPAAALEFCCVNGRLDWVGSGRGWRIKRDGDGSHGTGGSE